MASPYETILGETFASLHAHVQQAHLAPLRAEGTIDVEHGAGWLVRPMIWLLSLPAAGPGQPVRLEVAEDGAEQVWTRRIGRTVLRSRQCAIRSALVERFRVGHISFDLSVENGALLYRQSALHLAGLQLPASVSPHVGAVVSGTEEGWRVVVTVMWRGEIICRYGGAIRAL